MKTRCLNALSPRLGRVPTDRPRCRAFSRADLLALLFAAGLLALLGLPALATSGGGAASAGCLNNLRRLAQGWLLFAEDHSGFLPGNVDDGSTTGYNWVGGQAGPGGAQEFNPEILQNPAQSQLASYLGREAEPFRCPADPRTGRYQGTSVAFQGSIVPAARSYSLNGAVGTQADGHNPTDGPWLDGNHNHRANTTWRTYGRLADIVHLAPTQLHTFVGEDSLSINDGYFATSMRTDANLRFVDWPESSHDFGGGFAFADGRAEIHRWQDPRTVAFATSFGYAPGNPDVAWVQAHTTARNQ